MIWINSGIPRYNIFVADEKISTGDQPVHKRLVCTSEG
jgi:hypothetical protein